MIKIDINCQLWQNKCEKPSRSGDDPSQGSMKRNAVYWDAKYVNLNKFQEDTREKKAQQLYEALEKYGIILQLSFCAFISYFYDIIGLLV